MGWIVATSLKVHAFPDCPGLNSAKRAGWVPTWIERSYGSGFYTGCRRCIERCATMHADDEGDRRTADELDGGDTR